MYKERIVIISAVIAIAGCTSRTSIEIPVASPISIDRSVTLDYERLELEADSSEEIYQLIQSYQKVSGDAADMKAAYSRASSLFLLLGAEYSKSKSEQRKYYKRAAEFAEQALNMDESFRLARVGGAAIPEAAKGIELDTFEPLFLWTTSVFYHFRDVASLPERILFNTRLRQAADVLEVMVGKYPDWNGGSLQFSLGIYYLSVPEVMGGDREKALQLMKKAVGMSNKRLLPRWGRAKYLASAIGDKDLFLEDLHWVLQQDLSEMEGPAIWNRYFQKDASRLLDDAEEYF